MALRRFICSKCEHEYEKLEITRDLKECPECGTLNAPALPGRLNSITYDTKDKYRGKKHRKNQDKQMRKRFKDHWAKYDAHDEVDRHGLNDAEKHGTLEKVKKI